MEFYARHRKLTKISGVVILTTGVGWVIAQINQTYRALNNVLDTSVIHYMESAQYGRRDREAYEDTFILTNWISNYNNKNGKKTSAWSTLKFAYARRLLNMTNSNNNLVRRRAVKHLANFKNLDDWHYPVLAHMVTAKTAVGLARTEKADRRFFRRPPLRFITYDHEMIINAMKELLMNLNRMSNHPCMTYFINRVFFEQDAERFVDHDSISSELKKLIQTAQDILPLCLESLFHHSTVKDYAKDIVLLNGLSLLMEIYDRFRNDDEINITLCNILSNISIHSELLEDIYRTGWIAVLSEWIKHNDVRISAPAARALANLDKDDDFKASYNNRVYILHPIFRTEQNTSVDVVFVHGLLGGVFFTWRQRDKHEIATLFRKETQTMDKKLIESSDPILQEYIDDIQMQREVEWEQLGHDFEFVLHDVPINTNDVAAGPYSCPSNHHCVQQEGKDYNTRCWPKDWLPNDCKNLRIIGINYDTTLSMWAPMCQSVNTKTTLEERSTELMNKLLKAGVGQRPIVWVAHSMGGLLVKNMLCKAWESESKEVNNMCSNTKAIVFYSTPHIGSRLANLSQATALLLWPSVEIQELREESPDLLQIHDKFLNVAKNVPMKIVSFVETKLTSVTAMKFNLLLVEPHSANPSIGEFFEIPQDHLGICKPASRQSFLYQKVLNLIKEVVHDINTNSG